MELGQVLKGYLSPATPQFEPQSLHGLCLRTAAIYATTCLYEFHNSNGVNGFNSGERGGGSNVVDESSTETAWERVFPLLDHHVFQLVPGHAYETFLDNVLSALEVAGHYDQTGKQLMQYIILFFPERIRRFRAQRYIDRVLMPTICCLYKCVNIEELYLEKADSFVITTSLLGHIFKYLHNLRVLALPKQCDDDVASIIGLNCPKLESIVLTGTNITNVGLSWLLCCRQLHTVIMPGFFSGITIKGVALLLNGIPGLRHVVYDVMSDVLTFVDFNSSDAIVPPFGLKTVLFHSMELLSSNHLELVTKLCRNVEWLSLDSALFYNLEGLGQLPNLRLLRLNYKSRPIDSTVIDFFGLSCHNLTTLQFFEVKDLHLDDFYLTVGQCPNLETFSMCECSIRGDWTHLARFDHRKTKKVLSKSVEYLQLFALQISSSSSSSSYSSSSLSSSSSSSHLAEFLSLFRGLQILELDQCNLDSNQVKAVLLNQPTLHTFRCFHWTHSSAASLMDLQREFRHCKLQIEKPYNNSSKDSSSSSSSSSSSYSSSSYSSFSSYSSYSSSQRNSRTMAVGLLADYANFSQLLSLESFS